MTVCCVQVGDDRIVIGADSATNINGTVFSGTQKWLVSDTSALGHAGSCRHWDLVRSFWDPKKDHNPRLVADDVKRLLREDGVKPLQEDGEPWQVTDAFLLVSAAEAWYIDGDFSAHRITKGNFWAIGSGCRYALGAAYGLLNSTVAVSPEEVVERAVKAAIKFDPHCGGDIFTRTMRWK